MKTYVFDASVVLGFLLNESILLRRNIEKIVREVDLGKAAIFSSPLINLEVANGLRFRLVNKLEAVSGYERFLDLGLTVYTPDSKGVEQIILMAFEVNATVYDCFYHFVANELGGTFLTCDKEYFKKAKKLGGIEFVGGK